MDAVQVAGEIGDGFAMAWNRHDMQALGRLFYDDADFGKRVSTCGASGLVRTAASPSEVRAVYYGQTHLRHADEVKTVQLIRGQTQFAIRAPRLGDDSL